LIASGERKAFGLKHLYDLLRPDIRGGDRRRTRRSGPERCRSGARVLAADVDECGGGDQFVAALLRVVPLEGGEQPIGEIGGPAPAYMSPEQARGELGSCQTPFLLGPACVGNHGRRPRADI